MLQAEHSAYISTFIKATICHPTLYMYLTILFKVEVKKRFRKFINLDLVTYKPMGFIVTNIRT